MIDVDAGSVTSTNIDDLAERCVRHDPLDLAAAARSLGMQISLVEGSDGYLLGIDLVDERSHSLYDSPAADRPTASTVQFVEAGFDLQLPLLLRSYRLTIRGSSLEVRALDYDERDRIWVIRTLTEILRQIEAASPTSAASSPLIVGYDVPSASQWSRVFALSIAHITSGTLLKIVPSAESALTVTSGFTREKALRRLRSAHPTAHLFDFPGIFGASPELILKVEGRSAISLPLAGTTSSSDASDLLESKKDAREHSIVVDEITAALRRSGGKVNVEQPELYDFGSISHIRSFIRSTFDRDVDLLELVAAIAPTPAIAGTPRDAAVSAIKAIEPEARGLFGGMIGYLEPSGDGELFLSIRAILERDDRYFLRAGVGIVNGSEEFAEYNEIVSKLESVAAPLR